MKAEGDTKRCSSCREYKPLVEFYRDVSKADNLTVNCRACRGHPLRWKWQRPKDEQPTTRRCPTCGETKDLVTGFYKSKHNPGGYRGQCKICELGGAAGVERRQAAAARKQLLADGYKLCTRCKNTKPIDEFGSHRGQPDGLTIHCKACTGVKQAASREKDPATYAAISARWYVKAGGADYGREHNARRRAAMRGAPVVDFTQQDWVDLIIEYGNHCAYCFGPPTKVPGRRIGLTQDHVIPLTRGGSHTKDNVVPACHRCNVRKGARTPAEWLGFAEPGRVVVN